MKSNAPIANVRHLYHLTVGNTIVRSRWMKHAEAKRKNQDYADQKWPELWRRARRRHSLASATTTS